MGTERLCQILGLVSARFAKSLKTASSPRARGDSLATWRLLGFSKYS